MHTKNHTLLTALAIIATVVVLGILAYVFVRKPAAIAPIIPASVVETPVATGDTASLVTISIVPGATISGAKVVTGTLTGAYFFEANAVGSLLDANKNVLKQFPIAATTDWMTTGPINFIMTVDTTGIAPQKGYLRIANDNPSGDPALEKHIDIPIVIA